MKSTIVLNNDLSPEYRQVLALAANELEGMGCVTLSEYCWGKDGK